MCENDGGSWTLYGVNFANVCWGHPTGHPAVYQNVTANVPWVKQKIAEHEASPQVCFKRFDG